MSATKSNLSLSLDEIIKNNKKGQKPEKRNMRRGAGNANAGLRKKNQGILKRKSLGAKKTMLKRAINSGRGKQTIGTGVNKTATQRLVTKLVKNALKRVTAGKATKVGAVRNVIRGRRGGVRNRGQTRVDTLNRVSQRSRVIGRRQPLNRAPIVASRGLRGNRRRLARREPNPIQSQLAFLRLQQQRQNRNQQRSVPVIRQSRPVAIQQRRPVAIQQRRPRVIYARPPPVRSQPQVIYVQQEPSRRFNQFSRGGRRPQRRNNDPFYDPPNYLQRVPIAGGQSYGRGRGRGGRFVRI